MKAIYISVNGGTGLNRSLCNVLEEAKKKYDRIAVLSPYWDLFASCKWVDRVYRSEEGRDFILDAKYDNAEIITSRLYDLNDFIYKRLNYEDAWRQLLHLKPRVNIGEPGEVIDDLDPLVKFPNTNNDSFNIISDLNGKGYENFIIVQFHGGQSPLCECNTQYDENNEPLQRHYPSELAQEFIDLFREQFPKTAIINYSLPNEPQYKNTERYDMPYLSYIQLAKNNKCIGFVSIDSSLQHLLSGIKPGVVIWGQSLPEAFGYKCNTNVIQDCRRDDILYMNLLGPSGAKIDYIEPRKLLDIVCKNLINKKDTQ